MFDIFKFYIEKEKEEEKKENNSNIKIKTFTCQNHYSVKEQKGTAMINIEASKINDVSEKVDNNIILCVDTSGSMYGKPMETVEKSIRFISDNMKKNDTLSIVTFSSCAKVILERSNDHNINDIIKKIEVGGCTNIGDGLKKCFQISKEMKKNVYIYLLSDGDATEGITDTSSLAKHVKNYLKELDYVKIHTFGYGEDSNEKLMKNISEHGGGYYYYANEEKIKEIFALCLGGTFSECVKDLIIEIKSSNKYKFPSVFDEIIKVGCVYDNQSKSILLPMILSETNGIKEAVDFIIHYTDSYSNIKYSKEYKMIINRDDSIRILYDQDVSCEINKQKAALCMKELDKEKTKLTIEQIENSISEFMCKELIIELKDMLKSIELKKITKNQTKFYNSKGDTLQTGNVTTENAYTKSNDFTMNMIQKSTEY